MRRVGRFLVSALARGWRLAHYPSTPAAREEDDMNAIHAAEVEAKAAREDCERALRWDELDRRFLEARERLRAANVALALANLAA